MRGEGPGFVPSSANFRSNEHAFPGSFSGWTSPPLYGNLTQVSQSASFLLLRS